MLTDREGTTAPRATERITVHTTRNGLRLVDADCKATTKRGQQCRNPFIHGQFWPRGMPEVLVSDGADTRMLAQRRCHLHVDHSRPAEVLLVFDDDVPSRFSGPHPAPVWQDPRSPELIRGATAGQSRADTLAVYVALTEHGDPDTLAGVTRRTGLRPRQVEAAIAVLADLALFRNGVLVGSSADVLAVVAHGGGVARGGVDLLAGRGDRRLPIAGRVGHCCTCGRPRERRLRRANRTPEAAAVGRFSRPLAARGSP